jgi:hypothetical protein
VLLALQKTLVRVIKRTRLTVYAGKYLERGGCVELSFVLPF